MAGNLGQDRTNGPVEFPCPNFRYAAAIEHDPRNVGERVKLAPRRMYTSLRNDASNGTEVFRVPCDYALKTLGETFDQNICDGALAPTARPLF